MSLSRGKILDPGQIGIQQESLPPLPTPPLDLRAWFGPDPLVMARPLELEIGSGKGTFLIQQAAKAPLVNYIGVEWARAFWLYASDRCRRHGLTNVRLLRAEAGMFVRQYVPDGCLRQVHIYFPDPWPKKRHHKRRLVQAPFLNQLHRVLEPAGCVRLATDHADYFQWMNDQARQVDHLFDKRDFDSPDSAAQGELVGTNFERKYRREGRPFYSMVLARR